METRRETGGWLAAATAVAMAVAAQGAAAPRGNVRPAPVPREVHVARIAGVARLWGTAKVLHPVLGHPGVDWDQALVETLPEVDRATSTKDYADALASLLARLDDPVTRLIRPDAPPDEEPAGAAPPKLEHAVRREGGTLVVDVMESFALLGEDPENAWMTLHTAVTKFLPGAEAVILDVRGWNAVLEFSGYGPMPDDLMAMLLSDVLVTDLPACPGQYRLHQGYAPQAGNSSGGYHAGTVTQASDPFRGKAEGTQLPVGVLMNRDTVIAPATLCALQAGGFALVMQEGERAPNFGYGTVTVALPEGLSAVVRTTGIVDGRGIPGFSADRTIPVSSDHDHAWMALRDALRAGERSGRAAQAQPQVVPGPVAEKTYADMTFPPREYRLLALFRFWNVIRFFYPYMEELNTDWDGVLTAFIPRFENCSDALDYQTAIRELATEVHDSHTYVSGARLFDEAAGAFLLPVEWTPREGRMVVAAVHDPACGLRVGDALVSADGMSAEQVMAKRARTIPAATPQGLETWVAAGLLRGREGSRVRLVVEDQTGAQRKMDAVRSMGVYDPRREAARQRSGPVCEVLPSGFGYVDLARLMPDQVDAMFEAIAKTPATIFDMRGYPNGTAWSVAPRLGTPGPVAAAQFVRPVLSGLEAVSGDLDRMLLTFTQHLPPAEGPPYNGRVVMLTNAEAISQAEHTCLFFEAAVPGITFIGQPTNGSNGDVTNFVLPGRIWVNFTGHGVRHADGRPLQRVGIQPHLRVDPTIRGLVEGRDEILEAAVAFLQKPATAEE